MRETTLLPKARTEGLVINELTDEVLVYDLERDKAHCLNPTAAAVWKLCDGHTTADEIARRLTGGRRQEADSRRQNAVRGSSPTGMEGSPDGAQDRTTDDRQWTTDNHGPSSMAHGLSLVWLALEQLGRDHLLEERVFWPASVPHLSRREALRRLGLGAAIAVPIIVSITAPTPAMAGTCKAKGQSCGTGSQCCSKACIAGTCA